MSTGPTDENILTRDETIAAILRSRGFWELAANLHYDRDPVRGGHPNTYPLWVFFLWEILIHVFGSARGVNRELNASGCPRWRQIRRAAKRNLPGPLIPSSQPPKRHHYQYALDEYLRPLGNTVATAVRRHAAAVAQAIGLADPTGHGSLTSPTLERTAFGDGKVMRARSPIMRDDLTVDTATGEIEKRRHDPDVGLWMTGTGDYQTGLKLVISAIKGAQRNQTVLLDITMLSKGETEVDVAVDQVIRASDHLPGIIAYAYDAALRGTHINRLYREGGLIGIARTHRDGDQPRTRALGTATASGDDGTEREVEIHSIAGAPHVLTYAVDGTPQPLRLSLEQVLRRKNRDDTYRFYARYNMPDSTGGVLTLPLHTTTEDERRQFNRPEHLRPFPEGSLVYRDVHKPARASSESANRVLDDTLIREWAPHWGAERNQISMYAYMMYKNSQARALFANAPPEVIAA